MKGEIVVWASTRKFNGDDAVKTKLTVDFSQLNEDDLQEYALDTAVIKWQNAARRSKDAIPSEARYTIPKPGLRASGEVTAKAALVKMFGEERASALIEKTGDALKALEYVREIVPA